MANSPKAPPSGGQDFPSQAPAPSSVVKLENGEPYDQAAELSALGDDVHVLEAEVAAVKEDIQRLQDYLQKLYHLGVLPKEPK